MSSDHPGQKDYAYKRIADEIEESIRSGRLQPGDRLPTVRAFADQRSCHYHTVRRALQDLADKGLIERRQGSGSYVRDVRGRHAIAPQRKVGILFEPGKCGHYLDRLLRFLHAEADRKGLQMALRTTSAIDSAAIPIVQELAAEGCSCIILPWVSPRTEPSELIALVKASPIPVVTPLALPGIEDSSYITASHRTRIAEELITVACGYLRGLGYSNIGLIGPSYSFSIPTYFQQVVMAYSSYVLDHGLMNHACPVRIRDRGCYLPLLERWRPFFGDIGVFCYHDQIAVELQNTLIRNGVRVPDDVAILSHNNDPVSQSAMPGISSFMSAHTTIALTMLRHAENLVAGKARDPHQREPRQLMVRESCGGLARLGNGLEDLTNSLGVKLFREKKQVVCDEIG